jgi:hypothetical protein
LAALLSARTPIAAPAPGPPGGRPVADAAGFVATVNYIDAGIRYIDPLRAFFVAAEGELCFRGANQVGQVEFGYSQHYWCMPATAVNNIDALDNDISYIPVIRLWCRHEAPHCARKFGSATLFDSAWSADSITIEITPYRPERAAMGRLIELMGGRLETTEALR